MLQGRVTKADRKFLMEGKSLHATSSLSTLSDYHVVISGR